MIPWTNNMVLSKHPSMQSSKPKWMFIALQRSMTVPARCISNNFLGQTRTFNSSLCKPCYIIATVLVSMLPWIAIHFPQTLLKAFCLSKMHSFLDIWNTDTARKLSLLLCAEWRNRLLFYWNHCHLQESPIHLSCQLGKKNPYHLPKILRDNHCNRLTNDAISSSV